MSRDRRRWWRRCCPIHSSLLLPSFPSPFLSLSFPLAPCPAHRLKFKYCNVVPGSPVYLPSHQRTGERAPRRESPTDSEERRNESCEPRLLIGQCRRRHRRRRRAVPRGRREGRAQQSSRQSRAIPPSLPRPPPSVRPSCATVLPPLSNFCRRLLLHFCCRARARALSPTLLLA